MSIELISKTVADLDKDAALAMVAEALASGESAVSIVHAVQEGMQKAGRRYEQQEIYLSGLIMAGDIFNSVMELVRPGLAEEIAGEASGRVLLGTVAGDIHDMGKNMAALAFRAFGFTVEDLGVNVPPERFLEAAKSFKPDIVGLSGLLSTAFESMRDTVTLFREHGSEWSEHPAVVVIGGGTIDEHVARYVGAGHWTNDAMEGVRICQQLLEDRG